MRTEDRPYLTTTGRQFLLRRIAVHENAMAQLRDAIAEPESRIESVGEYLRIVRERDRLQAVLREALLVEDVFTDDPTVVEVGDRVIIRRDDGIAEQYVLVHPVEAAIDRGRISIDSPLGGALLTRHVGDTVIVEAPGVSYSCRILTATRPHA